MSQDRPQTTQTAKPAIQGGSTKTILVGLYANMMKLPQTAADSPITTKAVTLDTKIAATGRALLTSANRLSKTREAITQSVHEVGAKKATYELKTGFEAELNSLSEQINELNQERNELKKQYDNLVKEQRQEIRILLNALVDEEKSPQDVLAKLNEFESKQQTLATSVDKYLKSHRDLQGKLDDLHTRSYLAAQDKSKLPPPPHEKVEAATRRLT